MRRLASFITMVSLCAQAQVKPVISQRQFGDQVNVVRLAPRYATAIRMPEPVSSGNRGIVYIHKSYFHSYPLSHQTTNNYCDNSTHFLFIFYGGFP